LATPHFKLKIGGSEGCTRSKVIDVKIKSIFSVDSEKLYKVINKPP
jgi:hypothetical protein